MNAELKKIRDIFHNDQLLMVPYYQRRYVWDDNNWKRFADDLEDTAESSSNYFLGAIISKEVQPTTEMRNNGIADCGIIVDGQQRLTTLAIYMKILHLMTNKNEDFNAYYMCNDNPVIKHNCDDKPAFDYIMKLDTFPAHHSIPDCSLLKAYEYFKKRFEDWRDAGKSLDALRTSVYTSVKFVAIKLSVDDDEQQIFDTINSLGVDLTTDELLKNYLYQSSPEKEYSKWRTMFDIDSSRDFWGTNAAKSREEATRDKRVIDRFLHAFVLIKMWDFKNKLNDIQRKEFVKANNVYKACKVFVEEFGMDRIDLANEILEYAKLFKDNFDESILDNLIPSDFGIERISCYVNATQTYVMLPYILFVLKNVTNSTEISEICKVLETYVIRRKLAHSDDKMYTDLFSENLIGGQKCLTAASLKNYFQTRTSALAVPSDLDIKAKIGIKGYDDTSAQVLLYMFETKQNSSFTGSYNDYKAEQLMPKPCDKANLNWSVLSNRDDEEQRKVLIKTLGNYFLYDSAGESVVKKSHNEDLTTKKNDINPWIGNINSSAQLSRITVWNSQTITDRNNDIATFFVTKVWLF